MVLVAITMAETVVITRVTTRVVAAAVMVETVMTATVMVSSFGSSSLIYLLKMCF